MNRPGGDGPVVVSIVALDSYDPSRTAGALERLLDPLGGMERFVTAGSAVMLKPNLLRPAAPDDAVTPHPELIRAAARAAGAAGGQVVLSDSPATASLEKCLRKLGLDGDEPFSVAAADDAVQTGMPGGRFRRVAVSRRMLEADAIINLAKAKTHAQMVMTLAAKNMFGGVVGLEKARWHFRAGAADDAPFARLLVEVCELLAPRLNILDAVVGMEGNGPGSGDPRPLGFLMASPSPHALDAVFCRIIGIDRRRVPTLAAAGEMGLLPDEGDIVIAGPDPASFHPDPPWKPARRLGLGLLPPSLAGLVNRLLGSRPAIDADRCTACGQCVRVCAAGAMQLNTRRGRAVLKRSRCISCFCCQEICPEGAITASAGVLARLMG